MWFECDHLAPDGKPCDKAENYSPMNAIFTEPTRYEALEKARNEGWMISHNVKGEPRKCYCAFHAQERRESHYRVKQ